MGESVSSFGPLALAYMGDAVYEAIVREYLLNKHGNIAVDKYHRLATKLVCAEAQAAAAEALLGELDEEEAAVYRKARNAKSHAAPRGVATGLYHRSTGFEAVLGSLKLKGKHERAEELAKKAIAFLEDR